MNPFERLGMPLKLAMDEGELKTRIEEASRQNHPDAGGDARQFEEIRQAGELLSNPSARIRAAVEVVEGAPPSRGSIPNAVMDFFSPVATSLEEVNGFVGERGRAQSGLGRAVLDSRVPALKEDVETLMGRLEELESNLVARFPDFDRRGWEASADEMAEVARGLTFLRKWQGELREANGKIFEALLGG